MTDMTFHESYGLIPKYLLALIKDNSVSQADYDLVLLSMGHVWSDSDIDFAAVEEFIVSHSVDNVFRMPYFY